VGPKNGRYTLMFFYTGGGRAKRPSHTSQRSAAPATAAKMVAGAMAATGVTPKARLLGTHSQRTGGRWQTTPSTAMMSSATRIFCAGVAHLYRSATRPRCKRSRLHVAGALESLGMGPLGATDALSKDADGELVTRVLITGWWSA